MKGHPDMCNGTCLGGLVRLITLERALALQLLLSAAFQLGWALDPAGFVLF